MLTNKEIKLKQVLEQLQSIQYESIGSNELVETKTVMDKDGEIQQIKKIENYQNLTQKIVKSIHKI